MLGGTELDFLLLFGTLLEGAEPQCLFQTRDWFVWHSERAPYALSELTLRKNKPPHVDQGNARLGNGLLITMWHLLFGTVFRIQTNLGLIYSDSGILPFLLLSLGICLFSSQRCCQEKLKIIIYFLHILRDSKHEYKVFQNRF